MKKTRYLIEFGSGADLHGESATKAAQKAVKDAVSHCCMCGTVEIPTKYQMDTSLEIHVKVAVPHYETVNHVAVLTMLPDKNAQISLEVVDGGLSISNFNDSQFGFGSEILIANAAITIYLIDHST